MNHQDNSLQLITDIAILMASECSFNAILPNSDENYKAPVINCSFDFVKRNLIYIKNKKNVKEYNNEAINYYRNLEKITNIITKKNIKRCIERIKNDFKSEKKSEKIDEIISMKNKIITLDDSLIFDDESIENIINIPDVYYEKEISIYDEITGNFSESNKIEDSIIWEIYDESYDLPYIETLAIKLKPIDSRLNSLYTIKRILAPFKYELIRSLLSEKLSFDINDIILPY